MAKIIDVKGKVTEVSPENGADFSLRELQKIVGGYIEVLNLYGGELMVVNEEGKLKGLGINEKATVYLYHFSDYDDIVVGNVLICDSNQIK